MVCCSIGSDLILDSRLALFHSQARWLAVADLHYGYEVSQRAQGWLLPLWGMNAIAERLQGLITDYRPSRLIIVGDIVHSSMARRATVPFLRKLQELCRDLILIRGNHDRGLDEFALSDYTVQSRFRFHHGHLALPTDPDLVDVIGHHHPSWLFSDGVGTRLRAPALVQGAGRIILPAFSPWAAGAPLALAADCTMWACTPRYIFQVKRPESP